MKAHKCSALARRQAALGHRGFTCATIREVEGLAAAGLGDDLLLANEVLDARRLGAVAARVTVAVDSEETIAAAAAGGVREVLIDVNVGLPRCGCAPADAGRLAALARRRGLEVRGVMGYEGHAMLVDDAGKRSALVSDAMALLRAAHAEVGGDVVSAGGTGSFDRNPVATEIQAGSYALMDTAYAKLGLPFRCALSVLATRDLRRRRATRWPTAGSRRSAWTTATPRSTGAKVWFCSDEHVTFAPETPVRVGERDPRLAGPRRSDRRLPRAAAPRRGRRGARELADRPARLVAGFRAARGGR